MAKQGRPRKTGARYPSGDIKPERGESPHTVALRQPHRRDAPIEMKHHHLAETPFGTLNLIGALNDKEYWAGARYARIVARYRASILAPKPDATSIAGIFEPKYGHAPILDGEERKLEYDAAHEALEKAGHAASIIVARVVVHNEPVPHRGFNALVRGLNTLREHFDLTDKRKSSYLGK